jgi:hypothetical protein
MDAVYKKGYSYIYRAAGTLKTSDQLICKLDSDESYTIFKLGADGSPELIDRLKKQILACPEKILTVGGWYVKTRLEYDTIYPSDLSVLQEIYNDGKKMLITIIGSSEVTDLYDKSDLDQEIYVAVTPVQEVRSHGEWELYK